MSSKNDNNDTLDMGFQKIEIDISRFQTVPDYDNLPILATRNLVLLPGLTVTFELGRESSLALAKAAEKEPFPIGIVCQLDPEEENPAVTTGLYKYGTIADVLNVFERPDGTHGALVRAREKFRILGRGKSEVSSLAARVKPIADIECKDAEYGIVCSSIREKVGEALKNSDPGHIIATISQITDDDMLVNFLCTNLPFETKSKNELLAKSRLSDRAIGLLGEVQLLGERLSITEEIMKKAHRSLEENQKNAFLQQQMEAIRETLYGDESDEIDELYARGEKAGMPKKVFELFSKEIDKLRRYNPSSPDYSVQFGYLDTLVSLPWNKFTDKLPKLDQAWKILNDDHYGLDKVKERILEQLALIIHNPEGKAPILCLIGAPGVGKTSIGKSIARALGRKYERVSFGGLHDEAEIRGHRRTYIGAMPGRVIDAMKKAGVSNPVLVLDEIDKIGNDYKGDPAAALLEVLDPEQNCHFHDNYVDVDFDLSKVLFIATANTTSTIARPLLDRMELIQIDGYSMEEKMEIARRHLIPRILESHKLDKLNISDEALKAVISDYTAESGVRLLEKKLAAIARKAVLLPMQGKEFPDPVLPEHLHDLLGLAPHISEKYEGNEYAGVVTGLAWTEVGGEILMAESSLSKAKNGSLQLTGHLGDVMKESASIAYQWVKAHADKLGINSDLFDKYTLHVHFPEGAIPKDGPSAGITIATSMVSTFLQRRVAPRIAMTGEITLRGRVLPVGGIREKILAAKRAGINHIILCKDNRRDIEDIPAELTADMQFTFVEKVEDVLAVAITDEPVADSVSL